MLEEKVVGLLKFGTRKLVSFGSWMAKFCNPPCQTVSRENCVDMIFYSRLASRRMFAWVLVLTSLVLLSLIARTNYDVKVVLSVDIPRNQAYVLEVLRAEAWSSSCNDSWFVEDVVTFPKHLMLFIKSKYKNCRLATEEYDCVFVDNNFMPIASIIQKEPGLYIAKCVHPVANISTPGISVTLGHRRNDMRLPSQVSDPRKILWDFLVYEILSLPDSVLLFVKGPAFKRLKVQDVKQLACYYGPNVKTDVLVAAQEVVRCERPPLAIENTLTGTKVSVDISPGGLMPSVAHFNPGGDLFDRKSSSEGKKHFICACTVIWNQANFLKEWILYHSWLGVERWFLYDNNSDDNIEEVIQSLHSYNVSRYVWPWIKTQEAGFSHCATRAQSECDWVMFTDVDEFVYPKGYLKGISKVTPPISQGLATGQIYPASVMRRLINNATRSSRFKVGEIRADCFSFGPSGLAKPPKEGATVGYTCRMKAPERHKSIVKLDALNSSLLNVVHHFQLKSGFRHTDLARSSVVINHYKYQVWEVFKKKFIRRAATYITDWQQKQNELSKDRTPGLGTEAIEPPDWSSRFCEVNDSGLSKWTLQTFRDSEYNRMQWQ